MTQPVPTRAAALGDCLDRFSGLYGKLRNAKTVAEYLDAPASGADEEMLTEPILSSLLEDVLGFPRDAYVAQLQKAGRKPDFTPVDVIAHPFVLDAKSTGENLSSHEAQIRDYMQQRRLKLGVLFNLREVSVYKAGTKGHDPTLSFSLVPLWRYGRNEALPVPDELARLEAFCDAFQYREVTLEDKLAYIAEQQSWAQRIRVGEAPEIDVEALVERLRRLSQNLADDAGARLDELEHALQLEPRRERRLLEELELLAQDVSPGYDVAELPKTVAEWRAQDATSVPGRVWRQYLLRVAYLALTRIVLYRAWEDVEFVNSYLHDGGFDHYYEELGRSVQKVLHEAFLHGQDEYPWLFGRENNYDWYRPSNGALVDVLYTLAAEPLGKLDADVLGGLYESYVEEIDRDRLGQFFTPRDVVRFMLDRAGFVGGDVFSVEGDVRRPKRVLDFATGSGGFLVEAARRIIDHVDRDDPKELREALTAIVSGFVGGEISPFPYYLTEVNLLLQVSRLLGPLRVAEERTVQSFGALGVLPVDTLTAKSSSDESLEFDPELRADHGELVEDERFGLVPLDGDKREIYRERLRPDGGFDLVVGNPPYVAEANNKPLFDRLRAIPAWDGIYRGKTDYSYYFLWLAVEKLAPGGRLAVIVPAGWMNAGAADFLRKKLASELTLEQLFLFGSYRVFVTEGTAPTPTVESAILVATKQAARRGHRLRVVAVENERAAPTDRRALLEHMALRARGRSGRRKGVHSHNVRQADLLPQYPWPVKFAEDDVHMEVVRHLQVALADECGAIEPLSRSWNVFTGIETAADAYTARIQKQLSGETRTSLAARGAATSDPIMELPAGYEHRSPWKEHPELLARSPEPRAILYGAVDDADYVHYLLLDAHEPPRSIVDALEPWRPVLAARAEIKRNARRQWWETAWPRAVADLAAPKVIALYRTDRGRFALDEVGALRPGKKATVVVARDRSGAEVAYLCGLLNSELLDLWYAVRGKIPRDIWRNYEPKRMNEMPYRPPDDDPRADRVAELVRKIAANRRALLPHRSLVRDLGRVVKDPWKTGPVVLDEVALVQELDARETVSIRLDPRLETSGPLTGARTRLDMSTIAFKRGRAETGRIVGDPARVDLAERLVPERVREDASAVLLPKDEAAFELRSKERAAEVDRLLREGRSLVEEVERLVCALYDLSDDLTEEVVAHAVSRAAAGTPSE